MTENVHPEQFLSSCETVGSVTTEKGRGSLCSLKKRLQVTLLDHLKMEVHHFECFNTHVCGFWLGGASKFKSLYK